MPAGVSFGLTVHSLWIRGGCPTHLGILFAQVHPLQRGTAQVRG